ncbi:uncharacterized protein LOC135375895 [Ornithodoros turicata]|uniref:uncharacterized protein LOC135375895 n=1 Tax=Ornithodoros turicata TaxID=34597 RepID=UPI0031387062
MDQILQGIPHTTCYIDDILVTGRSIEEHIANLKQALKRLRERGVRLEKEKCEFFKEELSYLGHRISRDGPTTLDDKVTAPTTTLSLGSHVCSLVAVSSIAEPDLNGQETAPSGPTTGISSMAAARLQRWTCNLAAHRYSVVYKASAAKANADFLSRLPQPTRGCKEDVVGETYVFFCDYFENIPVKSSDISRVTCKDPLLSRVVQFVLNGWETQSTPPPERLLPTFPCNVTSAHAGPHEAFRG